MNTQVPRYPPPSHGALQALLQPLVRLWFATLEYILSASFPSSRSSLPPSRGRLQCKTLPCPTLGYSALPCHAIPCPAPGASHHICMVVFSSVYVQRCCPSCTAPISSAQGYISRLLDRHCFRLSSAGYAVSPRLESKARTLTVTLVPLWLTALHCRRSYCFRPVLSKAEHGHPQVAGRDSAPAAASEPA